MVIDNHSVFTMSIFPTEIDRADDIVVTMKGDNRKLYVPISKTKGTIEELRKEAHKAVDSVCDMAKTIQNRLTKT